MNVGCKGHRSPEVRGGPAEQTLVTVAVLDRWP